MHHIEEKRLLSASPELVYQVITDVSKYKLFLPWCYNSEVFNIKPGKFSAYLTIKFKDKEHSFRSEVTHKYSNTTSTITAKSAQNIFKSLENRWEIRKKDSNKTEIICSIDIDFRSQIFNFMFVLVKSFVKNKMIDSFAKRVYYLQKNESEQNSLHLKFPPI